MQSFALLPLSLLRFATGRSIVTNAMLLSILPAPVVLSAVWPVEYSLTFFFVVHIVTHIDSAIRPGELTACLHLVVHPGAGVDSTVSPVVLAVALNVILLESSLVSGSICPCEEAFSLLLSFDILPLVLGTIRPSLNAIAVLLIVLPLALVLGSIEMAVNSVAMCFVVLPLTVVHISVSVNESSFAISFVVYPEALIHGTIWPNLSAFALPGFGFLEPFALIPGVVFELDHASVLYVAHFDHFFVLEVSELLPDAHYLGVIIINFNLPILVVGVATHADACVHLHRPDLLSGDESSDVCLDLDQGGKLRGRKSTFKVKIF